MACDRNASLTGKLACRLSGGSSPVAARAAFVAGAAAVGVGVGAAVVQRRRQVVSTLLQRQAMLKAESTAAPVQTMGSGIPAKPALPGLTGQAPDRPKTPPKVGLRPLSGQLTALVSRPLARPVQPAGSDRCARCRAGSGKGGSWYRIEGRSYCPDCASPAARAAGVDLAPSLPAETASPTAAALKPIPGLPVQTGVPGLRQKQDYLPPERRVPLRFTSTPVRVNVGVDTSGKPAWHVVKQGYVALREDGQDTGLAITPMVSIGPLQKDGTQEVTEDTRQWMITHLPSGKDLGKHAFSTLENAQQLATILAQLDWTREENQISDQEISQVRRTFHYYSQALRQEQQRRPAAVSVPGAVGGLAPAPPAAMPPGSLTGLLVADNVGGVARVLEDNGERLFVADSFGQRYDIGRSETRQPQEEDFRQAMLAMPLEPAQNLNSICSKCGAAAATAVGSGQSWYRMDLQPFCPSCAVAYANDSGYELPETIGGGA
ncbi:MAG: hypothetical protein Kow0031_19290 [Anaerolineae bacterium]